MHVTRYFALALVALMALSNGRCLAQEAATKSKYPDPTRFEKAIREFEAQDAGQFPPPDAILCTGSSTMRMWHADIRRDLAPLTVIPRGFGGSTMFDLLHYCDRIVTPYGPRAVVIYEGDNDVAKGVGPEEIRDTFRALVNKVHKTLPKTRIYMLAIKPSYSRREMWSTMKAANRLLAEECARDDRLHFIDITRPLLDAQENARRELFREDDLHLNRTGYERLRDTVRPVLMKYEMQYEKEGAEAGSVSGG